MNGYQRNRAEAGWPDGWEVWCRQKRTFGCLVGDMGRPGWHVGSTQWMFNNFPEATHGGDIIHGASGFGLPPNETRYSADRAAILHGKSATSIILSFSLGSTVRNVAVMVGTPPECGRGKRGAENEQLYRAALYRYCRSTCVFPVLLESFFSCLWTMGSIKAGVGYRNR